MSGPRLLRLNDHIVSHTADALVMALAIASCDMACYPELCGIDANGLVSSELPPALKGNGVPSSGDQVPSKINFVFASIVNSECQTAGIF